MSKSRGPGRANGERRFRCDERMVLQRWKKRENISFIKTHREPGEADFSAAQTCFEIHWTKPMAHDTPSDVFNVDGTGIYFRALPEHTYANKLTEAKRRKRAKSDSQFSVVLVRTGKNEN